MRWGISTIEWSSHRVCTHQLVMESEVQPGGQPLNCQRIGHLAATLRIELEQIIQPERITLCFVKIAAGHTGTPAGCD